MDQNKKNNQKPGRPGGGKGGGWQGLIQVICWAGVLAILLSYANNYMRSAGTQSSSVEVPYSTFITMVESGDVSHVDFDNEEAILLITPEDGYIYTDPDGVSYRKSTSEDGVALYTPVGSEDGRQPVALQLFTVQIVSNDAVVAFLKTDSDLTFNEHYQAPMSPCCWCW